MMANVIYLRERVFSMLKKDLIFRNPLRVMGNDGRQSNEDILPEGGFGAVLARAGLGKTALLVQLALDGLLRGRNVLHVSLADPVRKVCLWYEEVFRNIAIQYDIQQMDRMWETILPHRLIMTFGKGGFSVPKLEERLSDLAEQDIFLPKIMLVDGLSFEANDIESTLSELKGLATAYGLSIWFAVRTHRDDPLAADGMPATISRVATYFDVAFQLKPDGKSIFVQPLKGGGTDVENRAALLLDPATMLIRDPAASRSA
jgi:hypothetical protein